MMLFSAGLDKNQGNLVISIERKEGCRSVGWPTLSQRDISRPFPPFLNLTQKSPISNDEEKIWHPQSESFIDSVSMSSKP
jgi:hypothetical protein